MLPEILLLGGPPHRIQRGLWWAQLLAHALQTFAQAVPFLFFEKTKRVSGHDLGVEVLNVFSF